MEKVCKVCNGSGENEGLFCLCEEGQLKKRIHFSVSAFDDMKRDSIRSNKGRFNAKINNKGMKAKRIIGITLVGLFFAHAGLTGVIFAVLHHLHH